DGHGAAGGVDGDRRVGQTQHVAAAGSPRELLAELDGLSVGTKGRPRPRPDDLVAGRPVGDVGVQERLAGHASEAGGGRFGMQTHPVTPGPDRLGYVSSLTRPVSARRARSASASRLRTSRGRSGQRWASASTGSAPCSRARQMTTPERLSPKYLPDSTCKRKASPSCSCIRTPSAIFRLAPPSGSVYGSQRGERREVWCW